MRLRHVLFLRQRHYRAIRGSDADVGETVTAAVVVIGRRETLRRIGGFRNPMLSPDMFRDVVFVGVDGGAGRTLVLARPVQLGDNVDPKTLNLPVWGNADPLGLR